MTPPSIPRLLIGILLITPLIGWSWYTSQKRKNIELPITQTLTPTKSEIGYMPVQIITRKEVPTVHAASAVELTDGSIRSYWFGGTREGAQDVSIWSSRWDIETKTWDPPTIALDPRWLENTTELNLRKLGNPVAYRSPNGPVELFVVGVSMGGWSGSAIYHLTSDDEGATFSSPRRLTSSPFFNISTLVKGAILETSEGGIIIPAYHEFIEKYPISIHLDAERKITYLTPYREAEGQIQPWIVPSKNGSELLLRDASDTQRVHTFANAQLTALNIPNPNSAVAAITLAEGTLLACNDLEEGRHQLHLYLRKPGESQWKFLHEVEVPSSEDDDQGINKPRYSYPWLMQTAQKELHLFYTWNRREIRHLRFDTRDWPSL